MTQHVNYLRFIGALNPDADLHAQAKAAAVCRNKGRFIGFGIVCVVPVLGQIIGLIGLLHTAVRFRRDWRQAEAQFVQERRNLVKERIAVVPVAPPARIKTTAVFVDAQEALNIARAQAHAQELEAAVKRYAPAEPVIQITAPESSLEPTRVQVAPTVVPTQAPAAAVRDDNISVFGAMPRAAVAGGRDANVQEDEFAGLRARRAKHEAECRSAQKIFQNWRARGGGVYPAPAPSPVINNDLTASVSLPNSPVHRAPSLETLASAPDTTVAEDEQRYRERKALLHAPNFDAICEFAEKSGNSKPAEDARDARTVLLEHFALPVYTEERALAAAKRLASPEAAVQLAQDPAIRAVGRHYALLFDAKNWKLSENLTLLPRQEAPTPTPTINPDQPGETS